MSTSFREQYTKEIQQKLAKELELNVMKVPTLERIVINVGVGKFMKNKQALQDIQRDLTLIAGQKPLPTLARKSISAFSVREGAVVGYYVTLRGQRMYDFLERLVKLVFPRVRDFQGVPATGFDGHGNFSFGFPEQEIFPEVDHDDISTTFGLQITVVTTAETDVQGRALLDAFGFPFTEKHVSLGQTETAEDDREARIKAAKEKYQQDSK